MPRTRRSQESTAAGAGQGPVVQGRPSGIPRPSLRSPLYWSYPIRPWRLQRRQREGPEDEGRDARGAGPPRPDAVGGEWQGEGRVDKGTGAGRRLHRDVEESTIRVQSPAGAVGGDDGGVRTAGGAGIQPQQAGSGASEPGRCGGGGVSPGETRRARCDEPRHHRQRWQALMRRVEGEPVAEFPDKL